jgi:hypothetical protein
MEMVDSSLVRKHAEGARNSKGLFILHFVQFQVHSAAYFSVESTVIYTSAVDVHITEREVNDMSASRTLRRQ